jgi:hypothetical protein
MKSHTVSSGGMNRWFLQARLMARLQIPPRKSPTRAYWTGFLCLHPADAIAGLKTRGRSLFAVELRAADLDGPSKQDRLRL